MKIHPAALFILGSSVADAFITNRVTPTKNIHQDDVRRSTVRSVAAAPSASSESLTEYDVRNRLSFRELQKVCRELGLDSSGTTSVLKARLLESVGCVEEAAEEIADIPESEADTVKVKLSGVSFVDASDKDFDRKFLTDAIVNKCERGHWKSATRGLRKLQKNFLTTEDLVNDSDVHSLYATVLDACSKNRLHGARASEPARKILEIMAESNMPIPSKIANDCVSNCVGFGPGGTHEGFGGIDPALAMLNAIESSCSDTAETTFVTSEAYGKVVEALAEEGVVEEAIMLLRAMVVEHSFTPTLSTFSALSSAAVANDMNESVLQVMTLAKAAGYELDSVASADAGRTLLADGVIIAERLNNLALGLRLLSAAQKAEGCLPDRGDDLVASSSVAAQRASTIIHRRAILAAVENDDWKLAVRILDMMPKRSLTPATSCWRNVVTVCAKQKKSRKATALLLDWVTLWKEGKVEKPPLSTFNSVINACEGVGEEELTLVVLEAMKATHDTDGNIITFNIALKRFAKLGNPMGCEGIIVSMIREGIEPNIVSYTTAIAACVNAGDAALAEEWLRRIRSRGKAPNFHTYNTALAACLDGKFESTQIGSRIADQMVQDSLKEVRTGIQGNAEFKSVLPDTYSKKLALSLMKQLRENWRSGDIDMKEAKATLRVPLLKIVDFDKSEEAKLAKKMKDEDSPSSNDVAKKTISSEEDISYEAVKNTYRRAEV